MTPAAIAVSLAYAAIDGSFHVRVRTEISLDVINDAGAVVAMYFGGRVYGKPRTDGSLAMCSGYELIIEDSPHARWGNRRIYDPVAGPFEDALSAARALADVARNA